MFRLCLQAKMLVIADTGKMCHASHVANLNFIEMLDFQEIEESDENNNSFSLNPLHGPIVQIYMSAMI